MTRKQINATGVVTYWNTTETRLNKLRNTLVALDAALEKYVPEASTPMSALRLALEKTFPGHLVRRLEVEGFEVVKEIRGEKQNRYVNVAAAWFDEDDNINVEKCDRETERSIHGNYSGQRGILQPVHVGTMLARILAEHLGGTMLRPKTGGIYWLSEDKSAEWEAIGKAVEEASVGGGSAIYMLTHQMDEAAVRAVRDAVVHEVTSEAERIKAEVEEGDLGAKALSAREQQAAALIAKVQRYESILDVALAGVRKSLGTVKAAAASAAVLASFAEDEDAVPAGKR